MVGPRPALPDEAALWDEQVHERLRVLPGITGMWQVSGRSTTSFEDYKRLDLYYVDNWSLDPRRPDLREDVRCRAQRSRRSLSTALLLLVDTPPLPATCTAEGDVGATGGPSLGCIDAVHREQACVEPHGLTIPRCRGSVRRRPQPVMRHLPGALGVLAYHRVAAPDHDPWTLSVTPQHFDEQLAVLRELGRVDQLNEALGASWLDRCRRRRPTFRHHVRRWIRRQPRRCGPSLSNATTHPPPCS